MNKRRRETHDGQNNEAPGRLAFEVERLLVLGEPVGDPVAAPVRYPTYAELAQRFGLSADAIGRLSRKFGCLAQRRQVQRRIDTLVEAQRGTELARTMHLRFIEAYLVAFTCATVEGRVPTNHPRALLQMIALRSFLLGEANSSFTGPTRNQMKITYRGLLEQVWQVS